MTMNPTLSIPGAFYGKDNNDAYNNKIRTLRWPAAPDGGTFTLGVLAPGATTYTFTGTYTGTGPVTTAVLDESRSYESRELVSKMTASEYFEVVVA